MTFPHRNIVILQYGTQFASVEQLPGCYFAHLIGDVPFHNPILSFETPLHFLEPGAL